jgi:hypothetical protein
MITKPGLAAAATLFGGLVLVAGSGHAWDRSKPMTCAMSEAFDCTRGKACERTDPAEIGAPRFFLIDLAQQVAQGVGANARERKSPIRTVDAVGPLLVLQGMDEAVEGQRGAIGWTASVTSNGGGMVLTAAAEGGALVVFGDCLVEE